MSTLSYPDAPLDAWVAAMRTRSSRRSFDGRVIAPDVLDELEVLANAYHPSSEARVVVVRDAPAGLFSGIIGAYGKVIGAPSALVFIGNTGAEGVDESVGYVSEAAVLEATRLGLDTCWIAGSFRPGEAAQCVDLGAGERVFGVSPLGYATARLNLAERTIFGHRTTGPKHRKPTDEIAAGHGGWPGWAKAGAEMARLAPSAMNRQPWRFAYADGRVTVSYSGEDAYKRVSKRLDCGIAMLHFEVGARHAGASGCWELLPRGRQVARFVLD